MPDFSDLAPLTVEWPTKTRMWRLFSRVRGALGFNPTRTSARFRPIYLDKKIVPTAYVAEDTETAIAEGLLRGVSSLVTGSRRRLEGVEVADLSLIPLIPTRAMTLMRLHGAGLTRFGLLPAHITDCEKEFYPYTAAWAQGLHDCETHADGIIWMSHQNNAGEAAILWKGKGLVQPRTDLKICGDEIPLDSGKGLEMVRLACAAANIDFEA